MKNLQRRVILALLAAFVLAASWWPLTTDRAREDVAKGLTRALTVFAAARTLGAVVSVAQSVQADFQPFGVGASIAPGQALQPLNELLDQFAQVMLAASVSFGIQMLLLGIGTHWAVSAVVSAAVLLVLIQHWRDRAASPRLQAALVFLLVMRFAISFSALASEALYQGFMADGYRKELSAIKSTPAAAAAPASTAVEAEPGPSQRLKNWLQRWANPKAAYEALHNAASGWADSIVNLIAIFVLQTILLPVGFLFLAWKAARFAVGAAITNGPPSTA